ncbi:MAG: MoaD/ThiS family protein [Acidimicrobiia bacterium]|nr:MoaD/ThiS family protein [Acidimicrobiia bacterium]
MRVRIPTPLRSYTGSVAVVQAEGTTIAEVLADLDRRYPGIRFRVVDEQGRLRSHVSIFVDAERQRDLSASLEGIDELTLMQALSGG